MTAYWPTSRPEDYSSTTDACVLWEFSSYIFRKHIKIKIISVSAKLWWCKEYWLWSDGLYKVMLFGTNYLVWDLMFINLKSTAKNKVFEMWILLESDNFFFNLHCPTMSCFLSGKKCPRDTGTFFFFPTGIWVNLNSLFSYVWGNILFMTFFLFFLLFFLRGGICGVWGTGTVWRWWRRTFCSYQEDFVFM